VVQPIATRAFLLLFTFSCLDLLVAALWKLTLLLETPLRAKFGARRRLAVDEAERGVVFGGGGEGVVVGEVKDGVGGVLRAGRVVEIAGPVRDAAQFVRTGEGGEWDVERKVAAAAGGPGFRRAPPIGVERNGSHIESFSHWRNAKC